MELAVLHMAPLTGAIDLKADVVATYLRGAAGDEDRLEHVFARAGPTEMHVFGFMSVQSRPAAARLLRQIAFKATQTVPELRLWRVV